MKYSGGKKLDGDVGIETQEKEGQSWRNYIWTCTKLSLYPFGIESAIYAAGGSAIITFHRRGEASVPLYFISYSLYHKGILKHCCTCYNCNTMGKPSMLCYHLFLCCWFGGFRAGNVFLAPVKLSLLSGPEKRL